MPVIHVLDSDLTLCEYDTAQRRMEMAKDGFNG